VSLLDKSVALPGVQGESGWRRPRLPTLESIAATFIHLALVIYDP
jgi:hypothetical protein